MKGMAVFKARGTSTGPPTHSRQGGATGATRALNQPEAQKPKPKTLKSYPLNPKP